MGGRAVWRRSYFIWYRYALGEYGKRNVLYSEIVLRGRRPGKNFSWERACLVRALWDDTASVHIKLFGLRGVFIKITWLGHSCFKIESKGYQIILDPYQDGSVPGYRPIAE